jgi:hypothetical protein
MIEHEPEVKIANLLAEFRKSVATIQRHGATEAQCWAFADRHLGPAAPGTMNAEVRAKARKVIADVWAASAVARSGV